MLSYLILLLRINKYTFLANLVKKVASSTAESPPPCELEIVRVWISIAQYVETYNNVNILVSE